MKAVCMYCKPHLIAASQVVLRCCVVVQEGQSLYLMEDINLPRDWNALSRQAGSKHYLILRVLHPKVLVGSV